ncbi:trypsin-like serine protease with PDZ domain [Burkholderiales bacterium JOSHI_001]|nr:trypsin-like serine protease with PDZ domain [Burkholderiales bacterium JOSHI_001]
MNPTTFKPSGWRPARRTALFVLITAGAASPLQAADELPDLIQRVRPSVQSVGFYKETNTPRFGFRGTAFAVGDGNMLVTNAHVVATTTDVGPDSVLMVNVRDASGNDQLRRASLLAQDNAHDLALLRVDGPALPALNLRQEADAPVREGQTVVFMGYPLGAALGFAPVTHRGMVSAIRPVAIPSPTATQLDARTAARIRGGAFELYQLDATAYPGNSGGPLFDVSTGRVIGVVNMVTLKGTRESALSQPSGISYAIPARHVLELLAQQPAR